MPITYKGIPLEGHYRIDLLERLMPVHQAQVLTYLCVTGCPVGLLINFNVAVFKDGVKRLVNPRRTYR